MHLSTIHLNLNLRWQSWQYADGSTWRIHKEMRQCLEQLLKQRGTGVTADRQEGLAALAEQVQYGELRRRV